MYVGTVTKLLPFTPTPCCIETIKLSATFAHMRCAAFHYRSAYLTVSVKIHAVRIGIAVAAAVMCCIVLHRCCVEGWKDERRTNESGAVWFTDDM